ncbi:hypothetical protein K7X08_017412 [Anisodus acutangulus]|uniref:peptide-methionine (S)-S-oxide reductase n=1 Tax=Anisodus acutangulus TaxID=402998 RepID=A0A9Q1R6B9_9SOLA|nr:hypothetical protein K7X08_017412 [Anisodus acutangulus]
MAIEICSSDESSLGIMSPARISFDISPTGSVPVEQYIRSTSPSSSIDFDFCVFRESFDLESSSADELFFDGKILPIEIKRRISSTPPKKTEQQPPPPPPLPRCKNSTSNTSITLHCSKTSNAIENKTGVLESSSDEKHNSKSFWRFKRSSSLNCGSGYARTLCPLPLLSRSNSTGSTPSVKHRFHDVEAAYGRVGGVVRTTTGYCGGTIRKPSYKEVSEGTTGHTEAVKITYDKKVVSYTSLCDFFWETHDPTKKNFLNFGLSTHLRSAIFCSMEEERKQAQKSKIRRQMKLNRRILTKIAPFSEEINC